MDSWVENNNRYLETSLDWLRLRLDRVVSEEPATNSTQGAMAVDHSVGGAARRRRFGRWMGHSQEAPQTVKLLTPGSVSHQQLLEEATASREAASRMDPPPALLILANRFGLSTFERDILLLCAAMEFDPSLASMYGYAQHNAARNFPTFALALTLFDDPSWDALSPHRPLRYARLIEISQPGSMPLTAAPLRADERIVNFLKGLNLLDDRLATLFQPVSHDPNSVLAASQRAIADTIMQQLVRSDSEPLSPVQLVGDAGSRLAMARQVCAATGHRLYRLSVETLPSNLAELETLARLWHRESVLLPVALYVEADPLEGSPSEAVASLRKFLSSQTGLVFIAVRETPIRLTDAPFAVEIQKPTPTEQCEAWSAVLRVIEPELVKDETPHILAGQFSFNLTDIHDVAAAVIETPGEEGIQKKLWRACRNLTRPSLDSLAQRLDPKATWNDLVLPDEQMNVMRQIAGQVRDRHKVYDEWGFARLMNRGFGISALFTGESGTGKTMAAEVIANDLELNLYRIDLSAVVSKYIGETEKNLRRLFDSAERGGAILFFDEADALFGKRSEVKDSHDRYANIEINYLLQRMEAFSGLAILATNMKGALDAAFSRRLRFIVNLPFPGVRERKLIWQKALPPQTPKKDLDYDGLARLNISGGNIHSIALNAAFIAAQNGQTVTMPILLSAARTELKKLGRGFSEAELRSIGPRRKSA